MVEGMGAIVNRTKEHLGTSDTAIIGMRRQLLNGAKALMNGQEPKAAFDGALYRRRSWSDVLPRSSADDFDVNERVEELMTPMVS